jgi:hypothetical protein
MSKLHARLSDPQSTAVTPVKPEEFDFDEYANYTEKLNKQCETFWNANSGVIVYRRMRVAECFSYGCKDMKSSLENQLGALKLSMSFKADIPNFLEPWYGIGTVASAFGGDYMWFEGNAPVMKPLFKSVDEAIHHDPKEVATTRIGKHTLNMIEYFIEKTRGKLPVSFTDSQSPLNMAGNLVPLDQLFYELIINPLKVQQLFDILADLSITFNREQHKLIGDALVLPGHGFASSKRWKGMGLSDDNAIMISPEQYFEVAVPSVEKICQPYGGPAFHSCGDWSGWINVVLGIKDLQMADAAFSSETDPGATQNLEAFHRFAGTGTVLNARIVGDIPTIEKQVKRLWVPGMKLVVVTYCHSPSEQAKAYDIIHQICC